MNDRPEEHHDRLLDAYLHGELGEPARSEFEQRLVNDPALAQELELQKAINQRLKQLHPPPVQPPTPAPLPAAATRDASPLARLRERLNQPVRPWHLAAAVALVALVSLVSWEFLGPGGILDRGDRLAGYDVGPQQDPQDYYLALVDDGFQPAWECPPDRLAEIAYTSFSAAITYTPPAEHGLDGEMLGAAYANIFSRNTVAMLAHVDDAPVVVLIDRHDTLAKQKRPVLPDDTTLHAHQRQLGSLAIVEISPLAQPRMLDLFFEAPKPEKRGSCLGHHDLIAYQ